MAVGANAPKANQTGVLTTTANAAALIPQSYAAPNFQPIRNICSAIGVGWSGKAMDL